MTHCLKTLQNLENYNHSANLLLYMLYEQISKNLHKMKVNCINISKYNIFLYKCVYQMTKKWFQINLTQTEFIWSPWIWMTAKLTHKIAQKLYTSKQILLGKKYDLKQYRQHNKTVIYKSNIIIFNCQWLIWWFFNNIYK